MKKIAVILVLISTQISCKKSNEASKIMGSDWLLGKWGNKSGNGNLLEIWTKTNDSLFIGESYFIKEKDTLHAEKMELKQKGENLLYISTIKGQDHDKPLIYNHNTEIVKQLVFENPANDYPKKIIYSPISTDRILIQISGIQEGKSSSTKYSLKKMK